MARPTAARRTNAVPKTSRKFLQRPWFQASEYGPLFGKGFGIVFEWVHRPQHPRTSIVRS